MKNNNLKQKIKELQDTLNSLLNEEDSENCAIFFEEFKKGDVVVNHSLNNHYSHFSYIPTEKFVELYIEHYYNEKNENNCYEDKEDFLRNSYDRISMLDKTDGITYQVEHNSDGYFLSINKGYNSVSKETFIELAKKHNLKINLVSYYNNVYRKLDDLLEDMKLTSEIYKIINSSEK